MELSESEGTYRASLRPPVRGLWSGVMDVDQFFDNFSRAVELGLTQAAIEGSKECGITPDDWTPEEKTELLSIIANQKSYIFRLALDIEQNSKANGGKLAPLFSRLDTWVNFYESTVLKFAALACGDKKKKWQLGPTEHCTTCKKLDGKVKRNSYWLTHVLPRNAPNPKLECGGWRCQCTLNDTDDPVSRGPLPNLP